MGLFPSGPRSVPTAFRFGLWPSGGQAFQTSISLPSGSGWNDIAVSGTGVFVAGGYSGNDLLRADAQTFALTADVPFAPGSNPARVIGTDANTAWTSLNGAGQVAKVTFP